MSEAARRTLRTVVQTADGLSVLLPTVVDTAAGPLLRRRPHHDVRSADADHLLAARAAVLLDRRLSGDGADLPVAVPFGL